MTSNRVRLKQNERQVFQNCITDTIIFNILIVCSQHVISVKNQCLRIIVGSLIFNKQLNTDKFYFTASCFRFIHPIFREHNIFSKID